MTPKGKTIMDENNVEAMSPFDLVDAEENLKVGHFRHWLENYFGPHVERDDEHQRQRIGGGIWNL